MSLRDAVKHARLPVYMRDAQNDRADLEQRPCVSDELISASRVMSLRRWWAAFIMAPVTG
jgi:hypothetical protein